MWMDAETISRIFCGKDLTAMEPGTKGKITTITFDQTRDGIALCTTHDKYLINELDRLCKKTFDVVCIGCEQKENGKYISKIYRFPKSFLKISPPHFVSKENTERKMRNALKLIIKKKKDDKNET